MVIDHFCIKKVRAFWLLASPILITFVLRTSNKVQGSLFTSFSIIDYLYTGNQAAMQKMVNIDCKNNVKFDYAKVQL